MESLASTTSTPSEWNGNVNALDLLCALIADGYAAGHTTPGDAGHVVTTSGDGTYYAAADIQHGGTVTTVTVHADDDIPNVYAFNDTPMSWRDVIRAIAAIA